MQEIDEESRNAKVESSSVNSYQVLQKVFDNPDSQYQYDTLLMSRRLQEYCEQFNTSLNTYSIVGDYPILLLLLFHAKIL